MKVNNNIISQANSTTESIKNSSLKVEDFLQIMAAEISNQNPFGGGSSGSNTDYISQLAQFTLLEEMSTIKESLNLMTMMNQQEFAFSLIGKEVTVTDGEEKITGTVEKIKFEQGYAVLQVNGKNYYMGQVLEIADKKEGE